MTLLKELFTECAHCPEWQVRVFTPEQKQRQENIHAQAKHTPTADAVTALVTADPMHAADVEAVMDAITYDAASHDGEVDPNRVRRLVPQHVQPQVLSATYASLVRQGRLERVGWTTNEDRRGRNAGKPLALWTLKDAP